ncbi:hypothetical protein N9W79_00930 [bacterium]|nr:hypothetical protein [bacterium]
MKIKYNKPLLGLCAAFAFLVTGCATYNASNLEIRKRSRLEKEAIVVDMRSLKTSNDISSAQKRRKNVKDNKSKLEVIRRDPPPQGYNQPY